MYSFLTLDLGDKTGWTRIDHGNGAIWTSGEWQFKPDRFASASTRYEKFERKLVEHLVLGLDKVFFEKVHRHNGTAAAHVYGGYFATLTRICDEYDVPYEGINVGTWKKSVIGKGNASKDDSIAHARIMGFEPVSDNHADSLCMAKHAFEHLTP